MVFDSESTRSVVVTATLNSSVSPQLSMKPIKLRNTSTNQMFVDTLHQKSTKVPASCGEHACIGSLMRQTKEFLASGSNKNPDQLSPVHKDRSPEMVLSEARPLLEEYYGSIGSLNSVNHLDRLKQVEAEVKATGTYKLTAEEMLYGAKLAWRNAARCIGRIQWTKLTLFDAQHCTTARQMFEAICEHIKFAINGGNLRSAITVFPPRVAGRVDYRVWNPQLVSYAGYENSSEERGQTLNSENNTESSVKGGCPVRGDPSNVEFTKLCQQLGWKGTGSNWDILPIVVSVPGEDPQFFPIPEDLVLRVSIVHPKYDWFESLKLQWYALPAVSNMLWDVGGVEYPACPFSGWYMDTEVAVRDLADPHRYNVLPKVAKFMGLDTSRGSNLWTDRAIVEVNVAVLHSFQQAKVTIMDHYSAADSFMKHMENEHRLRGGCPADWVWIIPPISGSLTPVYYQEMLNYELKPAYLYQTPAWKTHTWVEESAKLKFLQDKAKYRNFKEVALAASFAMALWSKVLARRLKVTILYATETGRSEMFAQKLTTTFRRSFNVSIDCMDGYKTASSLTRESLLLIVTSTFGNGDPPENGTTFHKDLLSLKNYLLNGSGPKFRGKFAVFALGSTAYPKFCAFGKKVDALLAELGGIRIHRVGLGDELSAQEAAFDEWAVAVFAQACEVFSIVNPVQQNEKLATSGNGMTTKQASIKSTPAAWSKEKVKLIEFKENQNGVADLEVAKRMLPKVERIEQVFSQSNRKQKIMRYRLLEREQLSYGNSIDVSSPTTIRVVLQTYLSEEKENLKSSTEHYYLPGDHLAVYPQNNASLVSALLQKLGSYSKSASGNPISGAYTNPDRPYLVHLRKQNEEISNQWTLHPRLPSPVTLREALTRYLDISQPPSSAFLAALADTTIKVEEAEQLRFLASSPSHYQNWREQYCPDLVDLLGQFPSSRPPVELLFGKVAAIQPRYYSISSSSLASSSSTVLQIDLTVGVVQFSGGVAQTKSGLCSNFLATVPLGSSVYAFLRSAPSFHLPVDPRANVILVGAGTGIAPFRAFLQHRDILMKRDVNNNSNLEFGKIKLFFGCRSPSNQLYRDELAEMIINSSLTEYYVAYSRRPGKAKQYVQDKLKAMSRQIYRALIEEESHIYICGDVAMAEDVEKTLKAILLENDQTANVEVVFEELKDNNRYHEDIFGMGKKNTGSTLQRLSIGPTTNGHLKDSIEHLKSAITFTKEKRFTTRLWKLLFRPLTQ